MDMVQHEQRDATNIILLRRAQRILVARFEACPAPCLVWQVRELVVIVTPHWRNHCHGAASRRGATRRLSQHVVFTEHIVEVVLLCHEVAQQVVLAVVHVHTLCVEVDIGHDRSCEPLTVVLVDGDPLVL
eukprot:16434565-Heterocapsa_arctica.AAC.1